MASIERTAYPRFKRMFTTEQLHVCFTPTAAEIAFVQTNVRVSGHQLTCLALLKSLQWLGYFPALATLPDELVQHVRQALRLDEEVPLGYDEPRTLYRHHQMIRTHLGITSWGKAARRLALTAVETAAATMDNPADLINVALETLSQQRYELPAFSTLDRLVRRVRTLVNQRFFAHLLAQLSDTQKEALDALLQIPAGASRSPYQRLKHVPRSPTIKHLQEWLAQLDWLTSLGESEALLAHLPPLKRKHFAAEARALDASEIRKFTAPKRYTLLLCLIQRAQVQVRDQLALMFIKRMQKIHTRAKEQLELWRVAQREKTAQLVGLLAAVVTVSAAAADDTAAGQAVRGLLATHGEAPQLLLDCEQVVAATSDHYQPFVWSQYRADRSALFRLIKALQFGSTSQDQSLVEALNFLRTHETRRGDWLPDEVDLSFASERWQKTVQARQDGLPMLHRRHFEACVFVHLAAELKTGDLCIAGSDEYADYRTQLLSWEECEPLVPEYCQVLGMPATATDFVIGLQDWLTQTAEAVDAGYPDNEQLIIDEQGRPRLHKLPTREARPSVVALEAALASRLPERNVIDVLANVAHYTNWPRHFGPLSGSEPKLDNPLVRYLLTVFTYGCNLGPTQAARHLRGLATGHELSFVNQRHINAAKLNAAMVDIINAYTEFPLPKLWGAGTAAAADGTKYELYEQNLLAEYHIRYGGYGGIAYHHIADNYVALFSHFIPCGTWEAIYILEGLLQNASELQPETVHADTQGQSTPVYALAHLLGIKLMPRIRNWKDLIFYRPTATTTFQHIDALFTDVIDWKLIEVHWQDLLRVVLSIRAGKVSSVTLLRKLRNESRKNRLYQAFRELGRVVRTVFLLQYVSDPALRQQITAMTNKMESYNGFAKWFFFGNDGILGENDPEEQEKFIKYNDLVANAVIFQNVIDLSRALRELMDEGYPLQREDVQALSPYLTQHIKRFGDYFVDLSDAPPPLSEIELTLTF